MPTSITVMTLPRIVHIDVVFDVYEIAKFEVLDAGVEIAKGVSPYFLSEIEAKVIV